MPNNPTLRVPDKLTPAMEKSLIWWMQTYQPKLLKMTLSQFAGILHAIAGWEVYSAVMFLQRAHGWRYANAYLVVALAGGNGK